MSHRREREYRLLPTPSLCTLVVAVYCLRGISTRISSTPVVRCSSMLSGSLEPLRGEAWPSVRMMYAPDLCVGYAKRLSRVLTSCSAPPDDTWQSEEEGEGKVRCLHNRSWEPRWAQIVVAIPPFSARTAASADEELA